MRTFAKIVPLALVLLAGPAFAAQTVYLKSLPAPHGAITLGDLFDEVGAEASTPIGASVADGGATVLSAAQVQRVALQHGLVWNNEAGLRNIIIHSGAPAPASAAATPTAAANVRAQGEEVLTYAHSLEAGEIVQADDLVFTTVPKAPPGAAENAEDLIGKAARHAIRTGAVAAKHDVTAPMVIKQGDMISVSFDQGGVHLDLQAKAKTSAALGDVVTVQNLASTKVFQAVASGPGQAVVGPQAQSLRATAVTDPSRLALR